MTLKELAEKLIAENEGYHCAVLDDGSVACIFDLLFTTAITLGVTELSYKYRFCFESRTLAIARFLELKSENDEPQGYVARRPQ